MRKRGEKELLILKLGEAGKGWRLVIELLEALLLIRLSRDGMGGKEALVLAEETPSGTILLVLLENKGAGLLACESSAHPPRKERMLTMPIQMRRRSFKGFIIA